MIKDFIPNDYYRKKFGKIFEDIIDKAWETVPKPMDNCVWEDYSKGFTLMQKLKGEFHE